MSEVETELEELMTRPDGPFVAKLTREPGRRESRYMHLFSGELPPEETVAGLERRAGSAGVPQADTPQAGGIIERVERLEATVAELRDEIERLRARIDGGSDG